jgi:hypothetical protein
MNSKTWYIRFAVPGPTTRKKAKKK